MTSAELIRADARRIPLAAGSVQCCVTSPPYYGQRDYGLSTWRGGDPTCDHSLRSEVDRKRGAATHHAGRFNECPHCKARREDDGIGLELTPSAYVDAIRQVAREIWRVLRPAGTLWLNLGDCYFGDSPTRAATREKFDREWDPSQTRSNGGLRRSARREEGLKPKDLVGMPWRVALALQADGWWLRRDIIWHKPNPVPESMRDRPTTSHEYLFLLTKSGRALCWRHDLTGAWEWTKPAPDWRWRNRQTDDETADEPADWRTATFLQDGRLRKIWQRVDLWQGFDYFYEAEAIQEPSTKDPSDWLANGEQRRASVKRGAWRGKTEAMPGRNAFRAITPMRNRRSVWTIATQPYTGAHFAVFPEELPTLCILAGSRPGDLILDPFAGSGTTGVVARKLARNFVGLDLSPQYLALAGERIAGTTLGMPL
jgi:DNA modification methylase